MKFHEKPVCWKLRCSIRTHRKTLLVTRGLIIAFRSCLVVAPKTNRMLHVIGRKDINHK
jgi:hypothetical protein